MKKIIKRICSLFGSKEPGEKTVKYIVFLCTPENTSNINDIGKWYWETELDDGYENTEAQANFKALHCLASFFVLRKDNEFI